jgi:hypothetical protein
MEELIKIVVTAPLDNADTVREAIGKAGGGKFGNYSFTSFSARGVGRFLPEEGAHPTIGKVGKMEVVEEERIEVTCQKSLLTDIVAAVRQAHSYEEPIIDVYPLENIATN